MEILKNTSEEITDQVSNLNQDFAADYKEIFGSSENTVIVRTEWTKKGDYFEKLSLYDNSYSTVLTLGNTTLIK
jgi:hypothetical protein